MGSYVRLRLLLLPLLVFVVFLIFLIEVITDFDAVIDALSTFKLEYIPLILGCSFLNMLLRFVKWHYFLIVLGINLDLKGSLLVFFSGLSMVATPAKAGELIKASLVKEVNNVEMSRTAPVVVLERITDLLSLILLCFLGALTFRHGLKSLILIFVILSSVLVILSNKRIVKNLFEKASNIRFFKKMLNKVEPSLKKGYESFYRILTPKIIVFTVGIGVISWGFECIGMWLVLKGFGFNTDLVAVTFIFAFSSIIGALSMLPGGIGVVETSMPLLLVELLDTPENISLSTTLIIRICTLWFGIGIGLISLYAFKKSIKKRQNCPKTCRNHDISA